MASCSPTTPQGHCSDSPIPTCRPSPNLGAGPFSRRNGTHYDGQIPGNFTGRFSTHVIAKLIPDLPLLQLDQFSSPRHRHPPFLPHPNKLPSSISNGAHTFPRFQSCQTWASIERVRAPYFAGGAPSGDTVPRLFISHSSKDNVSALAFQRWLVANGWASEDVFIDLHGIGSAGLAANSRG